jgi:hypothetical protein
MSDECRCEVPLKSNNPHNIRCLSCGKKQQEVESAEPPSIANPTRAERMAEPRRGPQTVRPDARRVDSLVGGSRHPYE